jgi:hypothetical protein
MLGLRSTIKSTNEYSLNTQTTTGKTLTVASTGTPALHVMLRIAKRKLGRHLFAGGITSLKCNYVKRTVCLVVQSRTQCSK